MCKRIKRTVSSLVLIVVVIGVLSQRSEAARWHYHAFRRGHVTVWGTRNCRRVTIPLVYRRYMWQCQSIGGYLPWWCNDWLVRHEWGWPCYNVTWRKYVAKPCPRSCWREHWVLGPLHEYFEDYVLNEYGVSRVIVPTIGDPNGHITGNQQLYSFVDLGEWLDAGQPYTTPPPETDPNLIYYDFSNGHSPELPGFTVMHVEPEMEVEELIVFNPDADAEDYPFEVTRPDLLFTGRLYLEGEQSFDNEVYNGYLMAGDNNFDGKVDLHDLARLADVYLESMETMCTDMDGDGYGNPAGSTCPYGELDCNDTDPTVNPGAEEICDGIDNDCDGTIDNKDSDGDGHIDEACGGDDCDDSDRDVNPGVEEICDNGIDDDCDGFTDMDDQDCNYPPCWDCPTQCHGDVNCDSAVNDDDESVFNTAYGTCYGEGGYEPCADFNRDGCVDNQDGVILYTYYGYTPPDDCPPGAGTL